MFLNIRRPISWVRASIPFISFLASRMRAAKIGASDPSVICISILPFLDVVKRAITNHHEANAPGTQAPAPC
jgi:hypothetical protein